MNWQRKGSDYFVYMLAFEDVTTLYIVKRINALSLSLSLSLSAIPTNSFMSITIL